MCERRTSVSAYIQRFSTECGVVENAPTALSRVKKVHCTLLYDQSSGHRSIDDTEESERNDGQHGLSTAVAVKME